MILERLLIFIVVATICCTTVYPAQEFLPDQPSDQKKNNYPVFPDMMYEYRIAELNKTTPIEIEYNQYVRKYIDIFTLERRDQVSRFIGLTTLYFPLFEEYLSRYDLPLELKCLAVVESGLDPLARSTSDAIGLWQFLYQPSQMFDIQITSYVDERSDVHKSTDAACRYLKYLYQTFNDWNLVLAAYNGGPGELNKAIARSGGKTNFWEIYPYLTEAMRNYVPAFIAMIYVMNHYKDHQINPVAIEWNFNDLDTLHVSYSISFAQIGEKIGMTETDIRKLNPCYKLNIIPETGQSMVLVLPKDKAPEFLKQENRILSSNRPDNGTLCENEPGRKQTSYVVKKGDYLHKLAIRYSCTVDDICRWNNLSNRLLNEGTTLLLWVKQ